MVLCLLCSRTENSQTYLLDRGRGQGIAWLFGCMRMARAYAGRVLTRQSLKSMQPRILLQHPSPPKSLTATTTVCVATNAHHHAMPLATERWVT